MNTLNVEAFLEFAEHVRKLKKAIESEDRNGQLIALTQAIDSMENARRTMMDATKIYH